MTNFTQRVVFAGILAAALTPVSAQMSSRQTAPKAPVAAVTASMKPVGKAVKHTPVLRRIANPTDYGKEVTIVSEDFSKMTTGTPEEPDRTADMNYVNPDNVWINLYDDFTQTPGWGSGNAYPAGGAIYLDADGKEKQGRLTTPMLHLSGNAGISFIQFKIRQPSGYKYPAEQVVLEAAETYNMAPSWDFLGSQLLPEIDDEWQTLTYMYYGCGDYTIFNIVANDMPVIIDDVKVFQIDQYAPTPATYRHDSYEGTDDTHAKFNLHWDKVDGAEGYVLNVYTADENGNPADYLLKDAEVKDNAYTVDNAVSGEVYFYTVSSKKDGHVSIPSSPVQIKDVAAPNTEVTSDIADGKFTAGWKNVNGAERYNYTSYYKHAADKDGAMDVASLNLTGMKYSNDEEPEFSVDNPDTRTYDFGALSDSIGQAGWEVKHYAIYKDALTLDGFWTTSGSDAGLISPELDLSKDNGKFSVDVTACAEYQPYYEVYAQCAVALFNYDEEKKDYTQSELVYLGNHDINDEWEDHHVEFTTGTERSIVGIYAVYAPCNVYLSKVNISQNYKAGEWFYDPFHYERWLVPSEGESTSLEVAIPEKAAGSDIYQRAKSVRLKDAGDQYSSASFIESAFSPMQYVGTATSTGISGTRASLSGATVRLEGGNLAINNPENEPVYVYAADGSVVASDNSRAASVTIPAPGHGTYIVKVGKHNVKLAF